METLRKSNYAKTKVLIKIIFRYFTAKVIANMVLKFGDNRLNKRGVTGGVNLGRFEKKCNYAKTGEPIKMISRVFAANDITNIVLKFGDNRAKQRGVMEGMNSWKI